MAFVSKYESLAGKKFGCLTVRGVADGISGKARVMCKCDCGTFKIVQAYHLVSGNTKSCGHLKVAPRPGAGRPKGNKALSKQAIAKVRALRATKTGDELAELFGVCRKTIQRYAPAKGAQCQK